MTFWRLCALAVVSAVAAIGAADEGACTYNSDRCSCVRGEENQGVCWDAVAGTPGLCRSRYCRAGWTCACGGRTHLCYLEERRAVKVAGKYRGKSQAPCPPDRATGLPLQGAVTVASGPEILLGTFKFSVSPRGVSANDCNQIVWWHNGVVQSAYGSAPNVTSATAGAERGARENHYKLELRGGDVLAWRYKHASYYCQMHNMQIVINGTVADATSPGISAHYARAYSPDWFSPTFAPALGQGEADPVLTHFLPPRATMLNGTTILPTVDYWSPPNPASRDAKTSNWYWRIEVDPSCTPNARASVQRGRTRCANTDCGGRFCRFPPRRRRPAQSPPRRRPPCDLWRPPPVLALALVVGAPKP
jgi:hypothetical protein